MKVLKEIKKEILGIGETFLSKMKKIWKKRDLFNYIKIITFDEER